MFGSRHSIPHHQPLHRPLHDQHASFSLNLFRCELKLGHLCFHCTRVTFITRGARAGVPESAMMKMVNHASKEIHRIYQRLADADALGHRARFAIPTDDAATA